MQADNLRSGASGRGGGDIKLVLELLAHEMVTQGHDALLGRLRDPALREAWDRAFENIPPEHWPELAQAFLQIVESSGASSGLIRPNSPTGRGIFGRARLDALSRIMASDRLQALANLTAIRGRTAQ